MPRTKAKPKIETPPLESEVTAAVVDAAALFGLELRRRNVGGLTDPSGRYVAFGKPGDLDWYATIARGPNRGRTLELEIKRQGFDPSKLKVGSRDRRRWDRQFAAMQKANADGGLGLWVDSGDAAARFFARVTDTPNLRIEFEGFVPWMTDEEETA